MTLSALISQVFSIGFAFVLLLVAIIINLFYLLRLLTIIIDELMMKNFSRDPVYFVMPWDSTKSDLEDALNKINNPSLPIKY